MKDFLANSLTSSWWSYEKYSAVFHKALRRVPDQL